MEPRWAVRIWVRTRGAIRPSVDVQSVHRWPANSTSAINGEGTPGEISELDTGKKQTIMVDSRENPCSHVDQRYGMVQE